jgi:hypothetical protein
MGGSKIIVSVERDYVYFHVFRDIRKYFDLEALLLYHEELTHFVEENRYLLQKQFFQKKELLNLV